MLPKINVSKVTATKFHSTSRPWCFATGKNVTVDEYINNIHSWPEKNIIFWAVHYKRRIALSIGPTMWPNGGGYWLTFCTWLPYLMGWGNFLRVIINKIKNSISWKFYTPFVEPLKKVLFFAASCDICFANCNTIWYYQSVFPPYKYLFLMRAAKRCLVY